MAKSPTQFAAQAASIGPRMQSQLRQGVNRASLTVAESVRAELLRAGVKGGRLSGVGLKGAKIGVGFNVKGTRGGGTSLIKMRGPAHLIERDTKAHAIAPRRRGKKALATPFGPRASVKHPGTKGKHPWEKGSTRALPVARQIISRHMRSSLKEAFRL